VLTLSSIQISRFIIAFSWLYHGIFPKLVHIAPSEQLMAESLNLSNELTNLMIKSTGVAEVIFGLMLFVLYRSKVMIILNIIALFCLLVFVALMQTHLLIAAFNPVTTNITLIAFSVILLNEINKDKPFYNQSAANNQERL
jgi:hypothetical protein